MKKISTDNLGCDPENPSPQLQSNAEAALTLHIPKLLHILFLHIPNTFKYLSLVSGIILLQSMPRASPSSQD